MKIFFERNAQGNWSALREVIKDKMRSSTMELEEACKVEKYVENIFPKVDIIVYNQSDDPYVEDTYNLYFKFDKKADEAYFMLLVSGGIEL